MGLPAAVAECSSGDPANIMEKSLGVFANSWTWRALLYAYESAKEKLSIDLISPARSRNGSKDSFLFLKNVDTV